MDRLEARNPSLWMGTTTARIGRPLEPDQRADVVVVGAGIAGLTTARLLAEAGRSVIVLEAGDLGAGVTGFTTAKVCALQSTIYTRLVETWGVDRAATYAAANLAAVDEVRRLVAEDGIECDLQTASAVTYTETDGGVAAIEREAEAAASAGLDVRVSAATDLPYEVRLAVHADGQAQFHPRRYCLGLADALERAGARVVDHTRVLSVDDGTGRVVTEHGDVTGDAIVLATHVPISDAGGHSARMEPEHSYAMAFRSDRRPLGMYISVDEPTRSVRSTGDGWVIVGGEGHLVGHETDTTERYAALEAWTADRFDDPEVEYRWSAHDYASADVLPFIGRLSPLSKRTYVATGFGKWGMTNGTVAGMIIRDLIEGVDNPWAETFDATRIAPRQSAKGVVRQNVEVAKRFVGDRLATLRPPDASELSRGEGGIASVDGHKVAAFRDDDGELHCVSAVCTHLGCQVAFNTAERTWDCPCHGSRFDVDGAVLHGPAVADLAPKPD